MTETGIVTAIVTLVIATASGIGYLLRRRDNQKDPIPKQSAAMALANQSVAMMMDVAKEVRSEVKDVKTELAAVKAEAEVTKAQHDRRVQSLEDSVETLDLSLSAAVRFIEQLIRYMRAGAHGPEPAIPGELRDLIDPMLRHWGASGSSGT